MCRVFDETKVKTGRRARPLPGGWLCRLLMLVGLVLWVSSLAHAQRTNEQLMEILQEVVARDPEVGLLGIGSWTGSAKYNDPMSPDNLTRHLDSVSDHDLKVILPEGVNNRAALEKWRQVQGNIRDAVRRKYGSVAPGTPGHRVLSSINVYPPEQLVVHAENANHAARIFRDELRGYPNLGIDASRPMSLADIEKKAADGIWGTGKASYVQSYERQTGKLIYSRNGRVWVNNAELYHFGQSSMTFTPEGSISNAMQWLAKGTDALVAGDADKVAKHLGRTLNDIRKARNLLGVGSSPVTGELDVLVRMLEEAAKNDPARATALLKSGRIQRAIGNAHTEGRLIEGYLRMSGKERRLVKHLLTDPHPRWTRLRNALTELQLKLPTEQMAAVGSVALKAVIAYATYASVAGVATTAGEEGFLAAAQQAGLEVGMLVNLPVGLLAKAVGGILDEAKSFGFAVVSMTQDCENLLAGISQVKGSEGFLRASTDARELAERFARAASVRNQVFYFADQATQRDYGVERGEAMRRADEGRRDALVGRCTTPILQMWLNERLVIQEAFDDALVVMETHLATQPFLVAFEPDPVRLPAPENDQETAEPVRVAVNVQSMGDWNVVRDATERMRTQIRLLGGTDGREGTYYYDRVTCFWTLSREEGDTLVKLREEQGRCSLDDLEYGWEVALSRPGVYLVEFDWRLQFTPSCPYCPVATDYSRFHRYKTAGRIEAIVDHGLAVAVSGLTAGEDEARLLHREAWSQDRPQSVMPESRWLAVSPHTDGHRAALRIETATQADPGHEWQIDLLRMRAPEWVMLGDASAGTWTLSRASPMDLEVPFAVGQAAFDDEGEIMLDFAIETPRGERFERSARVPIWVVEPVAVTAEFQPARRDSPPILGLRIEASETRWRPDTLRVRLGTHDLAQQVTQENQGRVLVAEHRFTAQSPGPGRHGLQLTVLAEGSQRPRELAVDFDYLLSLEIAEHAIRPADEPDAAPRQGRIVGGEHVMLSLSVETFEPQPIADLVLTPSVAEPLQFDEPPTSRTVVRLVRGTPRPLEAWTLTAQAVTQSEPSYLQLDARVAGESYVAQPRLPLVVEPGETLVVVIDGPVDDAKRDDSPNNADGLPQAGETVRIPLRVLNLAAQPQPSYRLQVRADGERLVILDTAPQPGRVLVPGDSQAHWVSARVGNDVTGGALPFEAELVVDSRPEPLNFALRLDVPQAGPMAALRLPVAVFAFADEDTRVHASLPPRLMPKNPVFVWAFTDTTEVWRTEVAQLSRRFRSEDSGMARVLLYDGDSGALVAGGGTLVAVFALSGDARERAANRQAVTGMAAMIEGQMGAALAHFPGATLDEKYQAMAVAQEDVGAVSEAQRLAMLEQFVGMYGGSVDVERVRSGFARLLKDPPPILPDHLRFK